MFKKYASGQTISNNRNISAFSSLNRRTISAAQAIAASTKITHACTELDTHADSIVAGANCCLMHYTTRECDVSPYRDDYASIKNVPIVQAATAYQSPYTGQVYILILNEALWMGDSMKHTLINPNQLRHYGVKVQDNPCSNEPMHIMTEDSNFNLELKMRGTTIFADTYTPSEKELHDCPHIVLSSSQEWNPHTVQFHSHARKFEDEMTQHYNISDVMRHNETHVDHDDNILFNIGQINNKIINSAPIQHSVVQHSSNLNISSLNKVNSLTNQEESTLQKNLDIGNNDILLPSVFQSSKRHTDVSPEDLSERWFISIKTAKETLKRTTQRFLRSALLPLSRRYRADRMFEMKRLTGKWSTDTIDGRTKSLDGNRYAQIFANKQYFAKIYPMDSKGKGW